MIYLTSEIFNTWVKAFKLHPSTCSSGYREKLNGLLLCFNPFPTKNKRKLKIPPHHERQPVTSIPLLGIFIFLLVCSTAPTLTFPQGLLIKEEGTVQCWKCGPSIILESTQQQYPFLITSCPYRHLFRAHSSLIPTAAVTD